MKVRSRWRITLEPIGNSPIVILDNNGLIDKEIPWRLDQPTELVTLVDSAVPFIRPLGNATYTLDFTVYESPLNDFDARNDIMGWFYKWPVVKKSPLRINIGSETGVAALPYWLFDSAYIRTFEPLRVYEGDTYLISKKFSIIATGLVRHTS